MVVALAFQTPSQSRHPTFFKGRIMFDAIVFRRDDDDFVLNCDAGLSSHLVKHLKMYKLRRKIDVTQQEELQTWAVFESVSQFFFFHTLHLH